MKQLLLLIGTQGDQIYYSRDAGDHWEIMFSSLPPVYSIEARFMER